MKPLLHHRSSLTGSQLRFAGIILLPLVLSTPSWVMAQSQPDPVASPSSSSSTPEPKQDEKQNSGQNSKDTQAQQTPSSTQGKVEGTSNDRLFYTLPNFLTLNGGRLPPMPVKDKFKAVAVGNFDVVEFPWWGVLAAISQADNGDPAFGQGWKGYAKRYATTLGDSSVENFMVGAVFSSMLRQDPRFYRSGNGRFFHRAGYALSRMVVTFSDSGHHQFNFSEIVGAATAGAVSTYTYHPRSTFISTPSNPHLFVPSERTLSNAASTWGTQLLLDSLTLEIKEFWPDVHRAIQKHKHKASVTPAQ